MCEGFLEEVDGRGVGARDDDRHPGEGKRALGEQLGVACGARGQRRSANRLLAVRVSGRLPGDTSAQLQPGERGLRLPGAGTGVERVLEKLGGLVVGDGAERLLGGAGEDPHQVGRIGQSAGRSQVVGRLG